MPANSAAAASTTVSVPPLVSAGVQQHGDRDRRAASSGTAPIDQPTCASASGGAVRCQAASAIAANAAGHRLSSQAPAS